MAHTTNPGPFFSRVPRAHAASQPFTYPLRREWVEPDWRRLPGFRDVTRVEWETAQWQRAHTVKNLRQLLATWVVHDHNHVAQLQGALSAHYVTEVGPWRSFLGILDQVEP